MPRRQGFTLIEVIIVIVILGVLATLALPRITGNLQTAKAAEAMRFFGVIRRAYVNCMDMSNGDITYCVDMNNLGVEVPPGAVHTYTGSWAGLAAPDVVVFSAYYTASPGRVPIICMYIGNNGDTVTYDTWPLDGAYSGIVTRTGKVGTQGAAQCNVWPD